MHEYISWASVYCVTSLSLLSLAHLFCWSFSVTVKLVCLVCFLSLWAVAYGRSSGLLPWEASVMIAEKHKVFFLIFLKLTWLVCTGLG